MCVVVCVVCVHVYSVSVCVFVKVVCVCEEGVSDKLTTLISDLQYTTLMIQSTNQRASGRK